MNDSVFSKVIPQAFGHLNSWFVQPPLWPANQLDLHLQNHPSPRLFVLFVGPLFRSHYCFSFLFSFSLRASVILGYSLIGSDSRVLSSFVFFFFTFIFVGCLQLFFFFWGGGEEESYFFLPLVFISPINVEGVFGELVYFVLIPSQVTLGPAFPFSNPHQSRPTSSP